MHKILTKTLLTAAVAVMAMACTNGGDDTGPTGDTYEAMRVKSPDAGWRIEVVDPTNSEVKDLSAE